MSTQGPGDGGFALPALNVGFMSIKARFGAPKHPPAGRLADAQELRDWQHMQRLAERGKVVDIFRYMPARRLGG